MMRNLLLSAGRLALATLGVAAAGCSLGERVSETPTAPPLRFRLVGMEEVRLGGLDVRGLREPADLGLDGRSQLIRAYAAGALPLEMSLAIEAKNAGLEAVTLTGLDYEVLLDGKSLGSGRATTELLLPASGTAALPLRFALDARPLLGPDPLPALPNFALGLADRRRRPLRLGLRLRPSLRQADGHTARAGAFEALNTEPDEKKPLQ